MCRNPFPTSYAPPGKAGKIHGLHIPGRQFPWKVKNAACTGLQFFFSFFFQKVLTASQACAILTPDVERTSLVIHNSTIA